MLRFFVCCCVCLSFSASALIFRLPPKGQDLIGQVQYFTSNGSDTLSAVGMAYDVGRDAMKAANPRFKADKPVPQNLPIVVPAMFLLPDFPHTGIVVNLSTMRLYYYPPGTGLVMTYPLGIGKPGHMTPLGQTYVTRKQKDPAWIPPQSIRDYNKKKGIILPRVIRGGPDNPLGRRAIYLSIPQYLIHATNFPQSIGSRGSFGCMRMMEDDIEQLFPYVARKTKVMIVEQPYLAGWSNGQLYVEIHKPLNENKYKLRNVLTPFMQTVMRLSAQHHVSINWEELKLALQLQSGMPTVVSDSEADTVHFKVAPSSPKWPASSALCRMTGNC